MNPIHDKETFIAKHLNLYHGTMREWCHGKFCLPRVGWLNFGIHELGHFVFMPLGEFMSFLGGLLSQCLVPIGSFFMFYRQRDWFAMSFCFGWLSTNLYYVTTYIDDVGSQSMPILNEGLHDWAYRLGRMDLLQYDHLLATIIRFFAFTSMLILIIIGFYQIWLMFTLPKENQYTF